MNEPSLIMKTKLILLVTAVLTLGSLSSCVVPYGPAYGYNNYRPGYYGGIGLYNNYYRRPGYVYSGYRSPYYGRPGFVGYRPGYHHAYRPGYSGYRGGGFTHVGGYGGGFHHHHR